MVEQAFKVDRREFKQTLEDGGNRRSKLAHLGVQNPAKQRKLHPQSATYTQPTSGKVDLHQKQMI